MKTFEPYDPFVVFQPSKTFIQDVIKSLRSEALTLLEAQRSLNEPWQDWLHEDIGKEHKRIVQRINQYQYRLSTHSKENGWNNPLSQKGRITDQDIFQSKSVPIQKYYEGKLRKTGFLFTGTCPFHHEKTGSFTIYPTNDFHCFGCQANGDVITFIQKTQNLDFINAVKYILNL